MDLASANQGIDDMSFKDLTNRAAAAKTLKPADAAKTPAKKGEPEPAGKEAPAASKTS